MREKKVTAEAQVRLSKVAFAGVIAACCVMGLQGPAAAGSDNSTNAYAGDVTGLALPPGTFVVTEYLGYRHGDQYSAPSGNIFNKLTGKTEIPSTIEIFTSTTRLSYLTRLWDRPLVLEAAATFANPDVNIGNLPAPVGGLGPQTVNSGLLDPVLFVTYGLIVDPRNERFLGLTNFVYLPSGNYDKFKQVNVSAPGMTTWVPQLAYTEGLGKFGLKNFWFDLIANMSVHSSGSSPVALGPGVQFDKLTQRNSYDVKAFLRYEFMPYSHVAIGIERSWGGDQIASGGILETIFGGPTSLGKDDFTKGHLQLVMPLALDFQIAADFAHDFQREGGVRENFTAEIRLTKFFFPIANQPLK